MNNIYLNGVRIAALNEGGGTAYYLTDQVDSVSTVLDEDGKTLSRIQYQPYGETFVHKGDTDFSPKYNSQELDKETNFYFYNARYYDPAIARFTSADTVVPDYLNAQAWNGYSYVENNPIGRKDPTGHIPVDTVVDAAFIAYDVGMLSYHLYEGDTEAAAEDGVALALDTAGLLIPYATGLGAGYRVAKAADRANDLSKVVRNGEKGKQAEKVAEKAKEAIKTGEKIEKKVEKEKKKKRRRRDQPNEEGNNTKEPVYKDRHEALRKAKEANRIPQSKQPDKTIRPGTKEGDKKGLDDRNVVLYEYTNSDGEKIHIREDKPATYKDGGKQGPHFNAGPAGQPLEQHHNFLK